MRRVKLDPPIKVMLRNQEGVPLEGEYYSTKVEGEVVFVGAAGLFHFSIRDGTSFQGHEFYIDADSLIRIAQEL